MDVPGPLMAPDAEFEISLEGGRPLRDVSISRIRTPVTESTVRGGAYTADALEYKMRATIHDAGVVPLLTGRMLGPSTEFAQIEVTARTKNGDYTIYGILTDSVQRPGSVELGITITRIIS
ncbi:MAG: hypothetical protein EB829_04535 [Nitrosopumilus sp. H8]|nr:MAG: hypothetical protein EB829_04535 [Nitrosopumilus sp. H8]